MERQYRVPMLAMAIFLWLCTVPFVILLLRPRIGSEATLTVALALLALYVAVCVVLCRTGHTHDCSSGE